MVRAAGQAEAKEEAGGGGGVKEHEEPKNFVISKALAARAARGDWDCPSSAQVCWLLMDHMWLFPPRRMPCPKCDWCGIGMLAGVEPGTRAPEEVAV